MIRFLILLLTFSFSLCAKTPVLTSVAPTKYLVEQIGGEEVNCFLLVPPGASPHSYEPSLKQIVNASEAAVWFCIGEGFEKRVLASLKNKMSIVNLTDCLGNETLSSSCCCNEIDLHIWLSPPLLKKQSLLIAQELTRLMPEKKEFFEKRCQCLCDTLDGLDRELGFLLKEAASTSFLSTHPAFGYFCKAYGLEEISIEIEGKEASLKEIALITSRARAKGVKSILMPPQYGSKAGLALAKQLNAKCYSIDPYHEDVIATLREVAKSLL